MTARTDISAQSVFLLVLLLLIFVCFFDHLNHSLLGENHLQLTCTADCYNQVSLLPQHTSRDSKDPGLSVDHHPSKQEEEAVQKQKAEVGLQGWCARKSTEEATLTKAL